MKPARKKNLFTRTIEDTSILRKFTILFLVMSIVPLVVLFYLYDQLSKLGAIQLSPMQLNLTLTFVVLGVWIGYGSMRTVLKQLIDLTTANKKALEAILTPDKISEISAESNEIAALAESFSAITNRLEENARRLTEAKKTLHAVMTKIGQGIANMQNIDTFLELILESMTDAVGGESGIIFLHDKKRGSVLKAKSAYGYPKNEIKKLRLAFEEGTAVDSVLKSKQPLVLPKFTPGFKVPAKYNYIFKFPMLCIPLVYRDKTKGVVVINGRDHTQTFNDEDLNLLFHLASQTAVAIENAKLNEDLETTYFETISALALAVDAKDRYSRGHLDRVSDYCVKIGKRLGLDDGDLKTLRDAARLHDIGKIGIPDDLLFKEGSLSDDEWILMRKHPEIGEGIIKPIRSLAHLCDPIRHHHEKLDGSGYPDGLRGENISPLVRILTIADIYDALTTDRSYRNRYNQQKAFDLMREMSQKIDQEILEVFIEALTSNED